MNDTLATGYETGVNSNHRLHKPRTRGAVAPGRLLKERALRWVSGYRDEVSGLPAHVSGATMPERTPRPYATAVAR